MLYTGPVMRALGLDVGSKTIGIAVGDPGLANADPRSFHFLAFATDPNVVPYKP